jgi:ankyrin repeat protein
MRSSWHVAHACLIAWLVAGAVSVSATDSSLVDAVKSGDAAVVRALIQKRTDVNAADKDGTTALHWAVRADDRPTAALLIAGGAEVNATNHYGVTPLSLAARNGSAALLDLLMRSGADRQVAEAAMPDGQTLLMWAARSGNLDAIDILLRQHVDVNAHERRMGATALIWAAVEDRGEAVQALVKAGADVNTRSAATHYPHTPPAVVGDPLEEGVSYIGQTVLPKGDWTALMYAARQGATSAVRVLIDSHADVNLADPDGTTALIFAIINGHYDVAAVLLDRGADPNQADRTGMTPLYAAVDMHTVAFTFGRPDPPRDVIDGSVPAIRTLLAHGADPNAALKTRILKRVYNAGDARLGEGATPFMRAARGADVQVMKILLEGGADPKAAQTNGNSPLMLAVVADLRRGAPEIGGVDERIDAMTLCLDAGIGVNAANTAGDTAAHVAATARAASPVLMFLSQHGAEFGVKNKAGRTPLDAALRGRDASPETIALLRKLGPAEGTATAESKTSEP